jgi:hypothetical protein
MRTTISACGLALACAAAAANAAGNFERLLQGEYFFSAEATCLISARPFNADLTPQTPPWPSIGSYTATGTRTFNGDGTGTASLRVVSITHPFNVPGATGGHVFNRGGASEIDFVSDFTYEVGADLKVTVRTISTVGQIRSGVRAGQELNIFDMPDFRGHLAQDLRGLSLAHEVAGVQRHEYSNGDINFRICHRSRMLLERRG